MLAAGSLHKRRVIRSLLPTACSLALVACGSNGSGASDDSQAAAPVENAAGPASAASHLPRVLAAMAVLLADPASALYTNLRDGSVGSICGSVAVPRPDGTHAPPVPFVVTPDGLALVSATPRLAWDAPEDPFPTAYARWCATPEELDAMRAAIAASPAPPPPEEPPPAEELPEDDPAPQAPPPPSRPRVARPPARPPTTRPEPPADPNDVSFTNAVRRPDE